MATSFNIRPLALPPTFPLTQAPTFDMGTVLNQSIAAGPGTLSTAALSVVNFKGCTVILNAITNTSTLNVTISGVDPTSGNTWPLLVTTGGMTAAGTTAHTLYPGLTNNLAITTTAGSYQNGILPTLIQISVISSVGGTSTFTVSAILTT